MLSALDASAAAASETAKDATADAVATAKGPKAKSDVSFAGQAQQQIVADAEAADQLQHHEHSSLELARGGAGREAPPGTAASAATAAAFAVSPLRYVDSPTDSLECNMAAYNRQPSHREKDR